MQPLCERCASSCRGAELFLFLEHSAVSNQLSASLGTSKKLNNCGKSPDYLAGLEQRSKLWIERDGVVVMSDWRIILLEAIDRTGSLTMASEDLGVPYRSACQRVKETEQRLGVRLVDTQSGGSDGGGSVLTETGHDLVSRFRLFSEGITELVDRRFKDAFG